MPGELKGRFTSQIAMGDIMANGATGVYGSIRGLHSGQDMIVAQAQQVRCGPARILTTLEGTTPQWYDVEIERVSLSQEDPNRNMVIRVTDPSAAEQHRRYRAGHERQPHRTGWQAGGRSNPCAGERPHQRLWDFCPDHAGNSGYIGDARQIQCSLIR